LKGTPSTTGSFPITVQVADSGGLTSTKTFTLTVEAPKLTITTPSPLASGTVGAAYSQRFSAAGGTPPYTWVIISGGPSGLALDGNALAGTPTAAGAFTLTVQARDTAGLAAAKTFTLQINPAALSIVTGTQLVAAVAGQAYNVQLTAAGGTPPYTWSETGTPDGLRLDPATGLLSGTPKAPGSFAIAIRVTDTARATVLGLFRVTIGVPDLPVLSVPKLPAVAEAAGQYGVGLELDAPYPLAMSGQLVLSFAPDSGGGDSTIQFSTGGRTADFNIPANETKAVFTVPDLEIQTGTVAGTIQLTARLNYGGVDVTPAPAPSWSTRVERAAPVVRTAKLVRSATGLEVQITGFCTAREVTQAVLRFTAASGSLLQTAEYTLPLEDAFAKWFQDPASVKFGSQFTFTQPFNLQGDPNAVSLESVTLSNRLGNVTAKP
jgi:hypothetical protein